MNLKTKGKIRDISFYYVVRDLKVTKGQSMWYETRFFDSTLHKQIITHQKNVLPNITPIRDSKLKLKMNHNMLQQNWGR